MKHPLTLAIIAFASLTAGCNQPDKPAAPEESRTSAEQFAKVKEETREAAQEMKDYTYAQKAEFAEKMESLLDVINRDLDQLAERIKKSGDTARAQAEPRLQTLRDQVDQLKKQLAESRDATDSTWDSVKAGFKKGYGELKDEFQNARQWMSDKIAP